MEPRRGEARFVRGTSSAEEEEVNRVFRETDNEKLNWYGADASREDKCSEQLRKLGAKFGKCLIDQPSPRYGELLQSPRGREVLARLIEVADPKEAMDTGGLLARRLPKVLKDLGYLPHISEEQISEAGQIKGTPTPGTSKEKETSVREVGPYICRCWRTALFGRCSRDARLVGVWDFWGVLVDKKSDSEREQYTAKTLCWSRSQKM